MKLPLFIFLSALVSFITYGGWVIYTVFNKPTISLEERFEPYTLSKYVNVKQVGVINSSFVYIIEDHAGNQFLTFRDNVIPLKEKP